MVKGAIKNILMVVPPEVHLLDINGPAHIFYEAVEYGADIKLHFVALDHATEIKSSAGLSFSKLVPFENFNLESGDFIFIPGLDYHLLSDPVFLKKKIPFFEWLVKQYHQGASLCSVCTGVFLLAESGILNNKSCTTHWKYFSTFKTRFPKIHLEDNRLFTFQDRIYTSAGVSSGIDLSLFILEQHYGAKFAADIAKEVVVYFRRSELDPQLNIYLQYRNHIDNRIHDIQDFLLKNIAQRLTLDDIAKEVNMSLRNLTRSFKKATGITIGIYLNQLKIETAIQLLSEGNKVEMVAKACGFKSANQLRNLLKKYKGILPSQVFRKKG